MMLRGAMVLALSVAGCASNRYGDRAEFPSPQAATDTLVTALRDSDGEKLQDLLGPDVDTVLLSGDAVADHERIRAFLEAYEQRHQLTSAADGSVVLTVGEQQWPLPIPLVRDDGAWVFSTERGKDEIISRRIGSNELDAVQVLLAIDDAQREYARIDPDRNGLPDYAPKFLSDAGRRNGLYWPTVEGAPRSPLGALIGAAAAEGYQRSTKGEPTPYHGYYYRMLTAQGPSATGGERNYLVKGLLLGGFGVVAWPAALGNSGVMSFIVNQEGVVYQRYLGPSTDAIARSMTKFDPGEGWQKVQ